MNRHRPVRLVSSLALILLRIPRLACGTAESFTTLATGERG